MKFGEGPRIAWRFLKIQRSHGAVGAIAAISVVGVAVAVAAIICVLSVFNGFREVLTDRNGRMLADIEVSPLKGRSLDIDSVLPRIRAIDDVELVSPVVSDQALAIYDSHEMPVRLYAIDYADLRRHTEIDSLIYDGGRMPSQEVSFDAAPEGLTSVGVASRLGAYNPGDVIFIFAPKRVGTINPDNPSSSFVTDSITTAGIFESGDQLFDTSTLIIPTEVARPLFMLEENEATSVAVKLRKGISPDRVAAKISEALPGMRAQTREMQQQVSFRMVNIEKWVTFLLLIFILGIASFNIISAMTMFIIEKQRNMQTLRSIGMTRAGIGKIFAWQSAFVTLTGTAAGMALGLLLCLLQQHYGLLTMGESSAGDAAAVAYPVKVLWMDFPAILVPIIIVGALSAWISASFARSRVSETRQ